MCAVTLIMAILENIDGIEGYLDGINGFYLNEIQNNPQTPNYRNMLAQGIMMNFWYHQEAMLQSLQQKNMLNYLIDFILHQVDKCHTDFEVKRIILGLTCLTFRPQNDPVTQALSNRYTDFMAAIVFLCSKSVEIKEKQQKKDQLSQAELDDCEQQEKDIYDEDADEGIPISQFDDEEYDEEEDWDPDQDEEELANLYDSQLDQIDEVLFVRD